MNNPERAGGRYRPVRERRRVADELLEAAEGDVVGIAVEELPTGAATPAPPLRGPGPVSIDEPSDPTFASGEEPAAPVRHRSWNLSSTQYHDVAPIEADLPEPGSLAAALGERIARRAMELWEESGRSPGRDLENWLRAEREIRELLGE